MLCFSTGLEDYIGTNSILNNKYVQSDYLKNESYLHIVDPLSLDIFLRSIYYVKNYVDLKSPDLAKLHNPWMEIHEDKERLVLNHSNSLYNINK